MLIILKIILRRKEELLEIPDDEPEMLHSILCKLPKPLNLENLISETCGLFLKFPPETLQYWNRISKSSVLKSCRYPWQADIQSVGTGRRYFKSQIRELHRYELAQKLHGLLWYYRKPLGACGLAVLVGVFAWWIRRPASGNIWDSAAFLKIQLRRWLSL
jgi:hypothetical protein